MSTATIKAALKVAEAMEWRDAAGACRTAKQAIERGHCKGRRARDAAGAGINPQLPQAAQWCMAGAIDWAAARAWGQSTPKQRRTADRAMLATAQANGYEGTDQLTAIDWLARRNDEPRFTAADALAFLDRGAIDWLARRNDEPRFTAADALAFLDRGAEEAEQRARASEQATG